MTTIDRESDEYYGAPKTSDGTIIGVNASHKVAFYGATPVVRRTYVASLHESSAIASSTDFTAAHLAVLNEVQNTLRGLGIWATA